MNQYIPSNRVLLTDAERERLILLIEECGEVIQAATKTLRWGYHDTHPSTGEVNREILHNELCDLFTILLIIKRSDDIPYPYPKQEKMVKLRRYTLHQPQELLRSVLLGELP